MMTFLTTAYPEVQENLKLKSDDHHELTMEPEYSMGTLASFKNLEIFGDQFLMDKPTET